VAQALEWNPKGRWIWRQDIKVENYVMKKQGIATDREVA
jgi:hypothetical protein